MLNPRRLSKTQHIWLWENRCKHHRPYVQHPACFLQEKPKGPLYYRTGYLDIETTGLNANWDYIISYVIKDEKGKYYGRVLTQQEVLNWKLLDKNLMGEFCRDVRHFDRIIVYWGKDRRHDIPFLRTRCLKWNHIFPLYRDVILVDAYDIAKNKLRLNRYRLQTVCDFLQIPAKAHFLDSMVWQRGKLGHQPSLDYIWVHNKEDADSLDLVFAKLEGFVQRGMTSI